MKVLAGIVVCFLACLMLDSAQGGNNGASTPTTPTVEEECKEEDEQCKVLEKYRDMKENCVKAVKDQIQMEMDASLTYLALGAHFSRDNINRPGFAKLFFSSASEEREHGIKLIEYLLMRGELIHDISKLLTINAKPKEFPLVDTTDMSGKSALTKALDLETKVTMSIRGVIKECETVAKIAAGTDAGMNHYHLVDYLTGVYLEEQYHGQRDLAEKIMTLDNMAATKGTLAEFLFDKTL